VGGNDRSIQKTTVRIFIMYTLHQILLGLLGLGSDRESELDGTCSTLIHQRDNRCKI
jgi:hypothetical protein